MHVIVLAGALASVIAISTSVSAQLDGRPRTGRQIYEEQCFRCHGEKGYGDGPDAASLIVPPTNFHSARSRQKSEMELLTTLEYGIAYSPMHGWRGRLGDDDLLEVIAYIRQLAPSGR